MGTITIDGRVIEFAGEPTILEVAAGAGIYIPTLCYLKDLLPIGSCRVCLVEVEGARRPMAACTTPATDGARVVTQSPRLLDLRRQAVQFVLVNHPLECPVCDKAGECRLQDITVELGIAEQPFANFPHRRRVDKLSPLIERSDPRCIRCGRCVAVCHEVQGVGAYRFADRGWEARVDTQDGGPLACEFCGQCVAVCPVGALLPRPFLHSARVWDLVRIPSTCGYCGAGCRVEWNVRPARQTSLRPRVLRVTSPRDDNPVNGGNLCIRGSFAFDVAENGARIRAPRVRDGGGWREVSWDEAFSAAAHGLRRVAETHGKDAVAGIGSARLTNEEVYALRRVLADGLGTPHIGSPDDLGLRQAQDEWRRLTGRVGSTATFDDLARAETIVVLGSDLAVEMPVPSLAVLAAVRRRDAALVVAYPVRTKLHHWATEPLVYRPGVEVALLAALVAAGAEDGAAASSPETFKARIDHARAMGADALASRAGLDPGDVRAAARRIASGRRTVFVVGNMLYQAPDAAERMRWVAALAALAGAASGEDPGLLFSIDRANAQGVLEAGLVPGEGGLGGPEILDALADGRVRALVACGLDLVTGFPGSHRTAEALGRAEFLVAISPFENETTRAAHVVLPSCTLTERDGTMVTAERRLVRVKAAHAPAHGARLDRKILGELAARLGVRESFNCPAAVFRRVTDRVPAFAGVGYRDLGPNGLLLPQPEPASPAGGDLPPAPIPDAASADPGSGRPYLVLLGAELFHNGTLTTYSAGPMSVSRSPYVKIHPDDARALGVAEGEPLVLRADGCEVAAPTRLSEDVRPGTLFAPIHFPELLALGLIRAGTVARVAVSRR